MSDFRIVIGADFVPTKSNLSYFTEGRVDDLVGSDLSKYLKESTFSIFNLEVPFADCESPIKKCGPNLMAPPSSVVGYKALGVNVLCLANNHVLDQGHKGLVTTLRTLASNDILHVGAGNNLLDASKPLILDFRGKKVGIYACAEHEFSIASENCPGANPFNALESFDHIKRLKDSCDYVIVLYHGGREFFRYPSPNLQSSCRKFVDSGANLVICQHSHCIGCMEEYGKGSIVYGQGNFLFDYCDDECWQDGLLVQLNEEFEVSYIPIIKKGNVVRKASYSETNSIIEKFLNRSNEIKQDGKVEFLYKRLASDALCDYLLSFSSPLSKFFLRFSRKFLGRKFYKWVLDLVYTDNARRVIENVVNCESHRELLIAGLKNEC